MLRSMTAYGRKECDGDWGQLIWEIRSVNHRYLELSVRLPDELRQLEPMVREMVAKRVKRGKVECTLRYKPTDYLATDIAINKDAMSNVLSAYEFIQSKMQHSQQASPLEILRWPGVVSEQEQDIQPIIASAQQALSDALDDFVSSRQREGEKLKVMISERSTAIGEIVVALRAHRPAVLARQKEKLLARIADLDVQPDTSRLEQELVLLAQKLDVEEELDRLEAHVSEVDTILQRKDPIGRRLDFLMQEFNREANTLGSKSSDVDTTGQSVELKVLIEQMREQVQNIE